MKQISDRFVDPISLLRKELDEQLRQLQAEMEDAAGYRRALIHLKVGFALVRRAVAQFVAQSVARW